MSKIKILEMEENLIIRLYQYIEGDNFEKRRTNNCKNKK